MKDLANQLVLKWARRGPSERILVTDDFTRLTLDTIALTSMDYRFNSFYQDKMHPFVDAMLCWLKESGDKSQRGPVLNHLLFRKANRLQESWDFMTKIAGEIIANRRAHPTEKQDLLNAMIYGVDPKTGERMRDELIISEMITFLVAGQLCFQRHHLMWQLMSCQATRPLQACCLSSSSISAGTVKRICEPSGRSMRSLALNQ